MLPAPGVGVSGVSAGEALVGTLPDTRKELV